jgi:hypothetical protein
MIFKLLARRRAANGVKMKAKKLFQIVVNGILIAGSLLPARVAEATDVDRLLDLLVKKQVVTEQEASDLRTAIAADDKLPVGSSRVMATALVTQAAPAAQATAPSAPAAQDKPVTAASATRLSGWVSTRWTDAVGTTNPLEIRVARLQLAGNLTPQLGLQVLTDMVRSPLLLDARANYNASPRARITIGQFKVPFSQESLYSDRDVIAIERTLVGNALDPGRDNSSNGRDIGAQADGDLLHRNGKAVLTYTLGLFQGAGINRRDDNRRKDMAARLVARPTPQWMLAGDYYNGATGPEEKTHDRAAAEVAYIAKKYSVYAEYMWGQDGAIHRRGGYSMAVYRILPNWEGLVRFDRYEPTREQRTDTYLLGLNWYLNQWFKWQTNYGVVNDNSRTDNNQTVLTQIQFQF